jgi:two-component system response regulator MprA
VRVVADTKPTTGRILIVDDDEAATHIFSRLLKLEGYEVQTAGNAEMGLFEVELNRPDAIILDLHMPLVDGLEFLRRLRSQVEHRAMPVAIVTGDFFIDDDIASELKALGAHVTYKPLSLDELLGLTRNLLRVIN